MTTESAVRELERLGAEAWPSLERVELDGWVLRYSGVLGTRANSGLPVADGVLPLGEKLRDVSAFYGSRGAPALIQVSPASRPSHLQKSLASLGYESIDDVLVMTLSDLASIRKSVEPAVVEPIATSAWIEEWIAIEGEGIREARVLVEMLASVTAEQRFASVMKSTGDVVAVGRAVVQGEWLGFFNLATASSSRRQGYGLRTIAVLAEWGRSVGAKRAYLQVDADNGAAIHLYTGLGFTKNHEIQFMREGSHVI